MRNKASTRWLVRVTWMRSLFAFIRTRGESTRTLVICDKAAWGTGWGSYRNLLSMRIKTRSGSRMAPTPLKLIMLRQCLPSPARLHTQGIATNDLTRFRRVIIILRRLESAAIRRHRRKKGGAHLRRAEGPTKAVPADPLAELRREGAGKITSLWPIDPSANPLSLDERAALNTSLTLY